MKLKYGLNQEVRANRLLTEIFFFESQLQRHGHRGGYCSLIKGHRDPASRQQNGTSATSSQKHHGSRQREHTLRGRHWDTRPQDIHRRRTSFNIVSNQTMLQFQQPLVKQVSASVSIGLMISCSLSTWGYPSVSLPRMSLPDSPVKFTPNQESWFATVQLLMYVPGGLLGGVLCERLGPRKLLLLLAPLMWASFALMSLASCEVVLRTGQPEVFLLCCRAVQGLVGALINPVAYIYTYEVTGNRLRGTLTGLLDGWSSLGMLLCYASGCVLSWEAVALLVPSVTAIPAFCGLLLTPESPMWLGRKGKEEAAREALTKLRSASELSEDLEAVNNKPVAETSFKNSFREVFQKPNLLAIFAAALVIFTKEINGNAVVAIYIVHIFQFAGVGLDPNLSSVMVGSVRLACNCVSVVLMHSLRRKPMLSMANVMIHYQLKRAWTTPNPDSVERPPWAQNLIEVFNYEVTRKEAEVEGNITVPQEKAEMTPIVASTGYHPVY
ncbi:facilitated trehalose transporter Tret1-like [Penaeus indicus]|uniref:facilitated trehalose transporter Tret1-like n=1 Tax=Penaeus indicus TaxID=29960 RepID=UPI00300D5CC1